MTENFIKIITLFLLTVGSVSLCSAQGTIVRRESYEKGKVDAAENVKNEKFILKAWGLAFSTIYPWQTAEDIYKSILKEKYRINYEWVGGCMVDEETAEYVEGYNEVLKASIEVKYGSGILEKVREQAKAEYESKYGEKQRKFDRKFKENLNSPLSDKNVEGLKLILPAILSTKDN